MPDIGDEVYDTAAADWYADAERDAIQGEEPTAAERPEIRVRGGDLDSVVAAAEDALLKTGEPLIFQRAGLLVRAVRQHALSVADGIRRPAGSLTISPVTVPYLINRLTHVARFTKWDGRGRSWKPTDAPEKVARVLTSLAGEWRFPPLRGVIEAPTLRPDGSILGTPGYDVVTGLLFDPAGVTFDAIPATPAWQDARGAAQEILTLLMGFPFVAASDRAASLAAILTGLIRPSIPFAPLFGFRAPKMRSGKTLLADLVALFSTGRPCAVMSALEKPEEERKRLFAALIAGDVVICFDNIERPFGGAAICQALTQQTIRDRVLGVSENATVPTTATFLATGNNLVFEGDITARVVPCDIDPRRERPEERTFDCNLYEHVPAHRGSLVPLALTILRAYVVAGRPPQDVPRWGGFDAWSDWVRSALVWLRLEGLADPALGRQRIEDSDPVRRQLIQVLSAWHTAVGSTAMTASEVVSLSEEEELAPLRAALTEIASDHKGGINTRRLGNFLRAHERRIEGGLEATRQGEKANAVLWMVKAA